MLTNKSNHDALSVHYSLTLNWFYFRFRIASWKYLPVYLNENSVDFDQWGWWKFQSRGSDLQANGADLRTADTVCVLTDLTATQPAHLGSAKVMRTHSVLNENISPRLHRWLHAPSRSDTHSQTQAISSHAAAECRPTGALSAVRPVSFNQFSTLGRRKMFWDTDSSFISRSWVQFPSSLHILQLPSQSNNKQVIVG